MLRRALTALIAATLIITGCSAETGTSDLDTVKVVGIDTDSPKLTLSTTPLNVTTTVTKILHKGTGKILESGDIARIEYVLANGRTGAEIGRTYGHFPVYVDLANTSGWKGFQAALSGKTVGTKQIVALPPSEAYGAEGAPTIKLKGTDTLVYYMHITGVSQPLPTAKGKAQSAPAGSPQITVPNKPGSAAAIKPLSAVPTKNSTYPLIVGTGDKVHAGNTIAVNYTAANALTGKVFASTAKDPGSRTEWLVSPLINAQQAPYPPSFVMKSLIGARAGSRIVTIMPAKNAYPESRFAELGINAQTNVIVVVDILAITG